MICFLLGLFSICAVLGGMYGIGILVHRLLAKYWAFDFEVFEIGFTASLFFAIVGLIAYYTGCGVQGYMHWSAF